MPHRVIIVNIVELYHLLEFVTNAIVVLIITYVQLVLRLWKRRNYILLTTSSSASKHFHVVITKKLINYQLIAQRGGMMMFATDAKVTYLAFVTFVLHVVCLSVLNASL